LSVASFLLMLAGLNPSRTIIACLYSRKSVGVTLDGSKASPLVSSNQAANARRSQR
jgi:hypothetical protein